jgi:hypothetical protein
VEVADLHDLGAKSAAYGHPLAAHPLGHHDEHAVALDGGDHGEGVAGVAGGGLDDGVAPPEEAFALGAFDHVLRDARLYRTRRVEVLALAVDALYIEQRRVPHRVEDAARDAGEPCHGLLLLFEELLVLLGGKQVPLADARSFRIQPSP